MSRRPRAGTAGKPVTIRATASERSAWKRAVEVEGYASLSAWAVETLNARAARKVPDPVKLPKDT